MSYYLSGLTGGANMGFGYPYRHRHNNDYEDRSETTSVDHQTKESNQTEIDNGNTEISTNEDSNTVNGTTQSKPLQWFNCTHTF